VRALLPLRVAFHGTEATAEIAGVTIKGTHAVLGEPKAAVNVLVFGETMGVRKMTVAAE
jgi:hypothetical protein